MKTKSVELLGDNTMRKMATCLAATALVIGSLMGCAGDVELVDRTQPNRVKKSIFDPKGEWYFRPIVIENQYNQGLLFEGYEGEMDRIRWRIEKERLIAYRSYDLLMGAEQTNGSTYFEGNPVAVFKVLSHFDVQRQYNEATGEQNNVLVENTTDRPWYEREYMRIDWSQNLLNNPYAMEGFVTAISAAPYYVQEHEIDSPYRPEITENNINIVGNYVLMTDFRTCYYTFLDPYWCGTSEAKVKLSFMKVEDRDYETLYYPDVLVLRGDDGNPLYAWCNEDGTCRKAYLEVFERFGFFRHERLKYDNEWQWERDGRVFLGHRWNIWSRTHDFDGNAMPAKDRPTGHVTYFTNVDFPSVNDGNGDGVDDGLWRATAATQDDVAAGRATKLGLVPNWDEAFRETVADLKRQDPSYYDISADDIPPIFRVKKNNCNLATVQDYADEHNHEDILREYGINTIEKGNLRRACALLEFASDGDFTWQKQGDLRYSFIHWVDEPQTSGPLGYGPSAADPKTGEIISANANIYGAAIDTYAAYAADVVALMNGDLTVDEIASGEKIREHIEVARKRANRDISHGKMEAAFEQMHRDGAGYVPSQLEMKLDRDKRRFDLDPESVARLKENLMPSANRSMNKMDDFVDSPLEKEYMPDDLKRAMLGPEQFQPGQPLMGDAADFSALEWMTEDLKQKHHETVMDLGRRTILLSEWVDPGMISVSDELKNMTWEEVYDWMRREIYQATVTHEVGHTLGLRHNFQGSIDPLNYGPEFWEGYDWDDVTSTGVVDQTHGAEQHMYASIMDYSPRFYADDLHGVGMYDKAAIKFGYGLLVEAFAQEPMVYYENFLYLYDYTDYPRIFGPGGCRSNSDGCSQDVIDAIFSSQTQSGFCIEEDEKEEAALLAEQNGDWALATQLWNEYDVATENCERYLNQYFLDGLENAQPSVDPMYQRRDVPFDELVDKWTKYYKGLSTGGIPDVVPYKFCPDEYAYHSWVECKPWDKGANTLEVTRDRMQRYDSYYYFSNFKRDRATFNDWIYLSRYLQRLYDRYFSQMSNAFIYSLYSGIYLGQDKYGNHVTFADFSLGNNWQAAGLEGMNFMSSVLEQPEPGSYCLDNSGTAPVFRPTDDPGSCATEQLDVPVGVGKYYYTNWTDEYYYKATRIGTFYDKYAALFAMTDNQGFFYRDFSSYFDVGAFSLSYWSGGLKDDMLNLFTSAFLGTTGKFAWRYDKDLPGTESEKFEPAPVVDIYERGTEYQDLLALPRIESASSWSLRWYAVVLPMLRYNDLFDYTSDFANYSRICLEGYTDCMDYDPAVGQTTYTDPLTHYTYVASNTDRPEVAIGAKLLQEAQDYVDNIYTPALNAYDNIVAQCEASPGTCDEEEKRNLRFALMEVEREVNERTSFLDIVRDIGYYVNW